MSKVGSVFDHWKNDLLQTCKSMGCYPLVALVFLALLGWFGFAKIAQATRNTLADKLTLILNANVEAMKCRIDLRLSEVKGWAGYKESRREMLDLIELAGRDKTRETLLRSSELAKLRERLEIVIKRHGFHGFVVFDKSGAQIGALYDEAVGLSDLINRSDFVTRSLRGETVVSLPFRAKISLPDAGGASKPDKPTMFASTPIYDMEGKIAGVFAFRLRPETEFAILATGRSGETGETYAFDGEGLMISDSRFNRQLRNLGIIPDGPDSSTLLTVQLKVPKSTQLTRMAASATRGVSGVDLDGYSDYRGIPVVGAWTWLPEYGFGVATEIDTTEAFEVISTLLKLFLFLYAVLAASTALGLVFRRREMRAEESRQLILNSAGEGIYGLDVNGRVTFINPAAEKMFLYTAEEMIGRSAHAMIHHSRSDRSPYPRNECPIYAAFRDGLEHRASNDVFWRKDGTCFPVKFISTPILKNGELSGAVVTFNDITEQAQADAEREHVKQIMRIFIEHNPAPVAMFDRDMRYLAFSQRWLTDYKLGSEDITGRSHYEVFPEITENWKAIHRRCLAGASEKYAEDKFIRQDGSIEWVSWEVTPWRDKSGLIGGIIMLTEIITERKRAEELISRFTRIVENSFNEIYVFDSSTLRFVHVSLDARKNLGYSMEELTQLTVLDLKPEFSRKDLETLVEPLHLGIKTQVVFEAMHKRKDGTHYPVEIRLQISDTETPPLFLAIAQDITERKKTEKKLQVHNDLEHAIKQAQSKYLTETNFDAIFSELLGKVLALTKSEFGFVGEVFSNADGNPYLKTHALTNIAWDSETQELYNKYVGIGMEFYNMDTLFGAVITSGKPVIANDPSSDPRSGGTPKGHPTLNSFLGLPVHYGQQLVGMVGMANRAEEYDEEVVEFLRPFCETCANLIHAYRNDKQRRQTKEMLREANESLEIRIHERTIELVAANEQLRKLSRAAEQSPSSIIITDTAGKIEYVNPKFTQLSGYEPEEVIGKNPRILRSGKTTAGEYEGLWKTITSGGEWRGEFQNRKKNGDCYWGLASISPIKNPQGEITHFISSMEDITERKLAEEKLKNSLLEKEVLIREINHRAKNNMQIISSLIKLQSRDSEEPKFTKLLQDLGNRIGAMNSVHDQIFQSDNLSRIDTRRYIDSLTRNILSSYGENSGGIELNVDVGDISLDVETGVHCGLIINELVSNSLKHAFAPNQRGAIDVVLRHAENGNLELIVHDNGAGLREDIGDRKIKSMGMRLVTTLAENQLHGKIVLNRNRGTEFKIVFPASNDLTG